MQGRRNASGATASYPRRTGLATHPVRRGRPPRHCSAMRAEPVGHELDEARAHALLKQACGTAGLNADGARLLRIGSNAVYHLTVPVVVRISRNDADVGHARRTIVVARWLAHVNYPAVRVIDVDQPIEIDGHVITFWQSISQNGDQYATVGEVAEVLAELHRLAAP